MKKRENLNDSMEEKDSCSMLGYGHYIDIFESILCFAMKIFSMLF